MEDSITVKRLQEAIAAHDDELAEKLVQRLDAEDEEALIRMAESEGTDVSWWAIRSLAKVGKEDCVAVIVRHMESDDSAIRAASSLALAHLHRRCPEATQDAIDSLADLLTDDDGLVRQSAADSLARCGNDAVRALAKRIDSYHDGARARAAYALRKIATREAAEVLIPLLDDPNHLVRSYAYDGVDAAGALDELYLEA